MKDLQTRVVDDEETVRTSAIIALDYGLSVGDVTELITTLKTKVQLPEPREHAELMRDAETLRQIVADLEEPCGRLHTFANRNWMKLGIRSPLNIATVASATYGYRFSYPFDEVYSSLDAVVDALEVAANCLVNLDAREAVVPPRQALVNSIMMTAGHFWFEHGDEWPDGEFFDTGDGNDMVTAGSGLEFVVRVTQAIAPDVTLDELKAGVRPMQEAIGMTAIREEEEAEKAAYAERRARFRVVE